MRNRFDQLAKNILRDALQLVGTVETQAEVISAPPQAIDVWYVPDPALRASGRDLGMLAQIASEPCMIEPFHSALDIGELRDCLRKQLTWHHSLDRSTSGGAPFPALWILSAGRPVTAIESFRLAPDPDGPASVYASGPGLRLYVMVLSELPSTRETLLLRLLGSGRTLRGAIADLMALPKGTWERTIAVPWLVRLRFEVPQDTSARSIEEEELIVEIQKWYEELEQQIGQAARLEGKLEGEIEARIATMTSIFTKRLGRRLSDAEQVVLSERLEHLGEDRLVDLCFTRDGDALAAWLADPGAR
jgi:hypothetical protein